MNNSKNTAQAAQGLYAAPLPSTQRCPHPRPITVDEHEKFLAEPIVDLGGTHNASAFRCIANQRCNDTREVFKHLKFFTNAWQRHNIDTVAYDVFIIRVLLTPGQAINFHEAPVEHYPEDWQNEAQSIYGVQYLFPTIFYPTPNGIGFLLHQEIIHLSMEGEEADEERAFWHPLIKARNEKYGHRTPSVFRAAVQANILDAKINLIYDNSAKAQSVRGITIPELAEELGYKDPDGLRHHILWLWENGKLKNKKYFDKDDTAIIRAHVKRNQRKRE